ncbi:FkbM family methyltransferase [Maricaulis sp.]|uniref:FkbM family methyltransferase n=1 Tax=Maricaulis sp. TaxID=1486257 RepID=UPI00262BB8F0|nr:FkbM family methyltransferase [Maricaulis sp.]
MIAKLRDFIQKLTALMKRLGRQWRRGGRARSPKKLEAFRILKKRGVAVGAVIDVGVLQGTPELIDNFRDVHHFLFEPVDECARPIRRAYEGLNFTLIQKAVGCSDGEASLRILGEAGSMNSSAHLDGVATQTPARQIDVVSLDSFAEHLGSVENCLLKIDTDGHELSVLRGASVFLNSCSIVVVEVTQVNMADVVYFMSEHCFNIFDIVEPCYFDESLWQVDIIFLRNSIHDNIFDSISDNNFDKSKYEIYR